VAQNLSFSFNGTNTLFAIGLTNHNLANSTLFKVSLQQTSRFSNGSRVSAAPLVMTQCRR
jgi:hypothetical protein